MTMRTPYPRKGYSANHVQLRILKGDRDKTGGANPNLVKKEEEETKAQAEPKPETKTLTLDDVDEPKVEESKASKTKEVPIISPKKVKKESIDFKLLQRLMDERNTFQVLKKVYRLSFSLLCGVTFHFCHYAREI